MTLKITRSQLKNLSSEELYQIASKLHNYKESLQQNRLKGYLDTAHAGQIEFHKAPNKIRLLFGGNRCLREDQKIWTNNGLKAIGDICEETYVLSFDHKSKKFVSSLASASFPKRRGDLYRVYHLKGDFVASAEHRIFGPSGEYLSVGHLKAGSRIFQAKSVVADDFYQFASIAELYQSKSFLNAVNSQKKLLSCSDDYLDCIHLCDQLLHLLTNNDPKLFQQLVYEPLSSLRVGHLNGLPLNVFLNDLSMHIHSCLSRNHVSNSDAYGHEAAQLPSCEVNYILRELSRHTLEGSQEPRQFLLKLGDLLISKLFSLSRLDIGPLNISSETEYIESEVKAIEKVGHDWFWDLSVLNTNNYVTEDMTLHSNSGKTTANTAEILWRLQGTHPFRQCVTPVKGALVLQDFTNHANKVFEPKINEWAPRDLFVQKMKNQMGAVVTYKCKNGSVLDVYSHDQDPKVFESSDYDFAAFDEPCPEHLFKAIYRSLTDRGGDAWLSGTPITEPWIFELYERAKKENNKGLYWALFMSTYENALNIGEGNADLGRKRVDEFAAILDKDEKSARIDGRFAHLSGMIFKEWDRKVHLIKPFDWPHTWPIWVSIDPHPSKPWAVSFIGHTPSGTKVLVSSALVEGVVEDVGHAIIEMRDEIKLDRKDTMPRITRTIIDNYANVESMIVRSTTIAEELNKYIQPQLPKCESGPKDVKQKISIFKDWLKPKQTKYGERPVFLVFDGDNDRFVYEVEHYIWKKFKGKSKGFKDAPEKVDDDIIDSVLQVALICGTNKLGDFESPKPMKYIQ